MGREVCTFEQRKHLQLEGDGGNLNFEENNDIAISLIFYSLLYQTPCPLFNQGTLFRALPGMKTEISISPYHWIKGVSFLRNFGAALVGEYNRVIQYYQLSW